MAIRGQEIVSLIKRQIEEFGGDLTLVDVGTVVQVGDGVASIQGLQGVQSNELLDFGENVLGVAMNLESDLVGAAILGDPNAVKEGDRVRSTGQIIEVPAVHIIRLRENTEITWGGGIKGVFYGEHVFELQKLDDNKTRLRHNEEFEGIFIGFADLPADVLTQGYEQMNEALKKYLEGK